MPDSKLTPAPVNTIRRRCVSKKRRKALLSSRRLTSIQIHSNTAAYGSKGSDVNRTLVNCVTLVRPFPTPGFKRLLDATQHYLEPDETVNPGSHGLLLLFVIDREQLSRTLVYCTPARVQTRIEYIPGPFDY